LGLLIAPHPLKLDPVSWPVVAFVAEGWLALNVVLPLEIWAKT